jgi:hypothetical protein
MNATTKPATLGRIGTAALLKSRTIAGPRTIGRLFVRNHGTSAFYLQVHDLNTTDAAAALAATSAVPAYPSVKVLADTTVIISDGFSLKTGTLIAASSTPNTLTIIGADEAQIVIES